MPDEALTLDEQWEALKKYAKDKDFVLSVTVVAGTQINDEKPYKLKHLAYQDETLEESIKTCYAYLDTDEAKDWARRAIFAETWDEAREELRTKHETEILSLGLSKTLKRHYPNVEETEKDVAGTETE